MNLGELFQGLSVHLPPGAEKIEIFGITAHAQSALPGTLFIAKKGRFYDGNSFIQEAVAAGAVALLTEMAHPPVPLVPRLVHPDLPSLEPLLVDRFYGSPSRELFLVGVTGTNGKTTTS